MVDALDECSAAERRNYDNLFSMLSKIDEHVPLKVFFTSRPSADLERLLAPLPVVSEQVTTENTQRDIRLYVETHSEDLPEETRESLIQRIVQKSSGCFLWTVLVMQQLQDVYSLEETEKVLGDMPQEMEPLYQRNVQIMLNNNRTKRLAMTILRWTVCAIRPLTVDELKEAIKLDINDTVTRDLEKSISSLCGQLVYVDRYSRVQIVHQTARSFLTQPDISSDFQIDMPTAHLQLGLSCLKYLCGEEMSFNRRRRSYATMSQDPPKNALAKYACASFSKHLSQAASSSNDLYEQLTLFLRTNVLSWIERAAEERDLTLLVRTGRHIRSYMSRRTKHAATLQDDVDLWATDLPRTAAAFGLNLLDTPSAIHVLVAPFCPKNSIIYKHFSESSDVLSHGLQVRGLSYPDWHDRVSCLYYREFNPKTICCRDHRFAVGLSNGIIHVYKTSTCEQVGQLDHGESVRILQFGTLARVLASSGLRSVKLWDVTAGTCLLSLSTMTNPIALAFDEDDKLLIAATRSKEVVTWQTKDAATASYYVWEDRLPGRAPTEVAISIEHKLMAIVYRGLAIMLWSLETQQLLGSCSRLSDKNADTSHGIMSTVFNPSPDLWLLAVAYWDGEIFLYDTLRRTKKCSVVSDAPALAASPDGRTLAAGDAAGKVQLYDFETLQILYQITLSGDSIAALTFTSDSLRFLDIRGSQVNVWEPSALVRKDMDDKTSEPGEPTSTKASAIPYEEMSIINTMISCESGTIAICGRNNGAVDIQDLIIADDAPKELYKHKGSFTEILLLAWIESERVLVSVDNASRFRVVRLSNHSKHGWGVQNEILDGQLDSECPVDQVLLSPEGTKLLLSSTRDDVLWDLVTKNCVASDRREARHTWKWYTDPRKPARVNLFHDSTVRVYNWNDLGEVLEPIRLRMDVAGRSDLTLESTFVDHGSQTLIFKYIRDRTKSSPAMNVNCMDTHVATLPFSAVSPNQQHRQRVEPMLCFPLQRVPNRPEIDAIIGTVRENDGSRSLLLLTESGWICSMTMDDDLEGPRDAFRRHFFVPLTWLSASTKLMVQVTERQDVIFVRGEEIAVVQNGLENVDLVSLR